MASAEPGNADRTGRVDVETLADNASASRALDDLKAAQATAAPAAARMIARSRPST